MFSMTKSRELDEVQTPFYFVATRHYGEHVKIYEVLRDTALIPRCHPLLVRPVSYYLPG